MARRRRRQDAGDVAPVTHRVLVVNEEPDATELLVRLLVSHGHITDRAHDHQVMIERHNVFRPDCIILDMTTGGIGANLKLLDAVRGHREPELARTRVVLVATSANNALFSWQAGIDGFLVRPFHAEELATEVAAVLARPDEDRSAYRRESVEIARAGGRGSVRDL